MIGKADFEYAKLYDTETGEYCTDGSVENLVMGPETQKRFDLNTDDCAVTVCCITYKHEDYIRSALDGFLMQKTNFKFKVFVGEDCGPDGTADIVREYAEKYPDIIVPFIREKNMGAQRNLIDLCNHANSPYIAFCEGDDYWVDEYKLQKQFDYMQQNRDIRICYNRAEISAPDDWFLIDWFKKDKNGKMIFPDCEPSYKKKRNRNTVTSSDCVWVFPAQTATVFYRWNYDVDIPDWYYTGIIGDHPLFLMQLGEGKAHMLDDVMSVYRRSNVGVYMSDNMEEHFLKTRIDHIRWMMGMLDWYEDNLEKYPRIPFQNRVKHETANYFRSALDLGDNELIKNFFDEYLQAASMSLNTYLSSYSDAQALTRTCTWSGFVLIARHRFYRQGLRPYVWFLKAFDFLKVKAIDAAKAVYRLIQNIIDFFCYWHYTIPKKQKNLWAFTGFRNSGYMDNTMYFYEYVVNNHPEINAVWFTNDEEIFEQLKQENKPVEMIGTKSAKQLMSRAEIAVTDHFKMTDYNPKNGFNDKTKVVQLWHGVGFKAMGDGSSQVKNTTERGVIYSDDILPGENDSAIKKFFKKIKYFFVAPVREKFEKYFLFVCPGQERIDMIAKIWHIPMDNCFMAGHPRNLPVYNAQRQKNPVKIMYAPTYRFDFEHETAMINEILDAAGDIQRAMEEIDGEFYIRLHPHTWRNYMNKIVNRIKSFDRILLDDSKDVYRQLGTFSVMISDYSSIALDFAQLDRPTVFHCADYDWFVKNEAGFNLDFPSVIPGPMTANWSETIEEVKKYVKNPEKDSELRREKIKYFFDEAVNGPDNSERIVEEIKKRINLE